VGGNLTVGNSTVGTLSIGPSNNSTVTNTNGIVGFNAGSNGTVTVSGGNWTNSSSLYIGYNGTGTLNLSRTGFISS
jgi:T5SS/PEP-CTERM-associated repeat protein